MRSITGILIIFIVLVACKKEPADFMWERSLGSGNAYFVGSSPDSGIVACGDLNGKPYLIKYSRGKEVVSDYTSDNSGLFSSAWSDTARFIAAGSSNGKILLECIDNSGKVSWDTIISSGFQIERAHLYYAGNGSFIALGSACPDSASTGTTGIIFVKFDTTGRVTLKKEISETNFLAAGSFSVDNPGNIFLALTRKIGSAKTKASVAKYNGDFQKIWETELYNNPNFGAAGMDLILDDLGQVYVAGKTEVSREDGVLDNSFIASLSGTGSVRWKNYMELTNNGSALFLDDDVLMMLNMNCFIISMINPDDGTETEKLRMLSVCNSKETDVFGHSLDTDYNGNIVVSGTRGKSFYVALKASME